MKVWRNSEGREFQVASETDLFQDALVGDRLVPKDVMRAFGYELVEDSVTAEQASEIPSGSPHAFVGRHDRDCEVCGLPDRAPIHRGFAEQVGAPSENDESARLQEAQRKAWEEGHRAGCQYMADPEHSVQPLNPYDPEEFELECIVWKLGVHDYSLNILRDDRLIPGKTYVVRLKELK